ncbi:MAG: hypothetical protein KGO53_13875 [Alphaproteobacteria bacterium]|nr:hypothetical protein [Alphaproteobacteria bacterium]
MTNADLEALEQAGLIDAAKRQEIAAFLAARAAAPQSPVAAPAPRFDLTHVLWYAGALIIIAAMGIFTTDAFNRMGGWALTACGVVYGVALLALGDNFWFRRNLRIPGGLLVAAAVSMVPMIIYGVQEALGLWKVAEGGPGQYQSFYAYINASWVYMEAGTVLAALAAMARYRFPFILLIAAVALWFMSMDLAMWYTATPDSYSDFETRRIVSLWFGLVMIAAAWAFDVLKGRLPDMMFWIHIFGILAFWAGMTMHDGANEFQKFLYCLINLGLIAFSLFIDRRIYAVFGGMGVATYLGYLASDVFKDMLGFSFALSAIGLAIIFLGIWLHKNRARLASTLNAALPAALQSLRPADVR